MCRLRRRRSSQFNLGRAGLGDRAGLEGVWCEAEVEAALLEPGLLSLHHARSELVPARVLVAPEILEEPPNPAPGVPAERIGERLGAHRLGVTAVPQLARMAHRGGD